MKHLTGFKNLSGVENYNDQNSIYLIENNFKK